MKFRRRKDADAPDADAGAQDMPAAAEPESHGADAWQPPGSAPLDAPAEPATEVRPGEIPAAEPVPEAEPAVDGSAVELPPEPEPEPEPETGEVPVAEAPPEPEPEPAPEPVAPPPPPPPVAEPTPVVGVADSSYAHPPGSAIPSGNGASGEPAATQRPEVLAGAAFAGGLVAALILKRLGN